MSIATPDSTLFGSFEGLLAPEQTMSEELARYLLQFRFAPSEIDRMNELSRKAQLNALTAEEDQALEQYIFLADMQRPTHAMKNKPPQQNSWVNSGSGSAPRYPSSGCSPAEPDSVSPSADQYSGGVCGSREVHPAVIRVKMSLRELVFRRRPRDATQDYPQPRLEAKVLCLFASDHDAGSGKPRARQ